MAKPFVKWAGGKTQLIDKIDECVWNLRDKYDSFIYVEPFVGCGSVLFHLLETCSNLKYAIINDVNKELMNCYRVVASNEKYNDLKKELNRIQTEYNNDSMKEERFKLFRFQYNHWIKGECEISDVMAAAIFIFLNKCSFNGLYRVNQKGEYNAPWGQKEYVNLFDENELDKCHVLLNEKVIIMDGDYSDTRVAFDFARVNKCDFIFYMDPPYRPLDASVFVSHSKDVFDDISQEKLKIFCDEINKRGGGFLLSNSKSGNYFEELYDGYQMETVSVKRNVSSVSTKRGKVDEIIISNNKKQYYKLF